MRVPPMRRSSAALSSVLLAALMMPAEAAPLDWLAIPDPASETTAPADPAFAESCRASARERLGAPELQFDRPVYSARSGMRIVRMELGLAGQTREPGRLFRVVCAREAGGPVEAVVFDRPAEAGPRVTVLAGPTPEMRPRDDDPGYRIVIRDPSGEDDSGLIYQGYAGGYLPGLWIPDGGYWRRFDARGFFADPFFPKQRLFARRGGVLDPDRPPTSRIIAIPRGSSDPFRSGGIASPAISNFSPKAVRGGGSVRFRSGGGGARVGSFGR